MSLYSNLTVAAVLALVASPALPQSAQQSVPRSASPVSSDLAAVSAHIRQVGTMSAHFVQTDRQGRRMDGTLLLKRPGHIRFEYGKGANLLIVGDGKSLNVIDYEVRQVQRWPIGNSPLSALLDPSRDLARFGQLIPTVDPRVLSVAVRDKKRPEFGTITMIFLRDSSAPAGLTLQSWVALDSQNNRTTVRLSDIRYNTTVADSAFNWKDPRARRTPGR